MPSRYSRDRFCVGLLDDDSTLYLSDPEPFRYQDRADNIEHPVSDGESWESIALATYGRAEIGWVIADYQPEPVDDMTVPPTPGATLVLPSPRVVEEEVLSVERREEHLA